jgi:hypothetical protein
MQTIGKTRRVITNTGKSTFNVAWRSQRLIGCFTSCSTILIMPLLCATLVLLQAYFALTRETVIAEVVMGPMQTDERGDFVEIWFTQFEYPSALSTGFSNMFNQDPQQVANAGEQEYYKVYGDTVAIRGPLVTLHNGLRVLGYENVYKLAIIEGEYRLPRSQRSGEGSEFYINGGIEEFWWNRNDQEANFPFSLIIKRITIAGAEEFVPFDGRSKRYEIVVTSDAITWNFIEYVDTLPARP